MNRKQIVVLISSIILLFSLVKGNSSNITAQASLTTSPFKQTDYLNTQSLLGFSSWKWSDAAVVSTESNAFSKYPAITIDSIGNIHAVWQDSTNISLAGTDYDIFYKYWDCSTETWSMTEIVSTGSTLDSYYPSVVVDSLGNVFVVWEDFTNTGCGDDVDIFFRFKNSTTETWSTIEVISTESTSDSQSPVMVIDSENNLHVVWYDGTDLSCGSDRDIFYKYRDSSSGLWSTLEVVSTESTGNSDFPSLAIDISDNLYVVWNDFTDYNGCDSDSDIFYKYHDKIAGTWSTTEVVSTESPLNSIYADLAVDIYGDINVVWSDYSNYSNSGTDLDIFYKNRNNGLDLWTKTEVLSLESTLLSEKPSIAVDEERNLHVAWSEGIGADKDIFARHFDNIAAHWTCLELISVDNTGQALNPDIIVDSIGDVHLFWEDPTVYLGSGADPDIFYKTFVSPPRTAPILAFILPNPGIYPQVILDWNDVPGSSLYYIYRSTSYIWSTEGISPLDTTEVSTYTEYIDTDGVFFYAITAANFAGNSTLSNCQYVEKNIMWVGTPELAIITPTPTDSANVYLDWNDILGVSNYYIFRSESYIWSIEGMAPIAIVSEDLIYGTVPSFYTDTLPSEGIYFYVIVATSGGHNSSMSNCEYVTFTIAHLKEFAIVNSFLVGLTVITIVFTRFRKKNQ